MAAAEEARSVLEGLRVDERIAGDREAECNLANGDKVYITTNGILGYDEIGTEAPEITVWYASERVWVEPDESRGVKGNCFVHMSHREMDTTEAGQIVGDDWIEEEVKRIAAEVEEKGLPLL